jgi:hypothetical protein
MWKAEFAPVQPYIKPRLAKPRASSRAGRAGESYSDIILGLAKASAGPHPSPWETR